jgi:carotenoid cleavage dioxygenase-like enzyme
MPLFLISILSNNAFLLNKYKTALNIKNYNRNVNVNYTLPDRHQEIVNKLNGFYGIVGPNLDFKNIKSLYDLFTGDGLIHGIFFDNGQISIVKHLIRTDKIIHEEKHGRIPLNIFFTLVYMFLNTIGVFPNIMGLANTAIMRVRGKYYSLFERDVPYEVDIDFKSKTISTVKKVELSKGLTHFSAHSKINDNYVIETIDYDVINRFVTYHSLAEDFTELSKNKIKCKYIPIIHDFASTSKSIIIADSALKIDLQSLFKPGFQIVLDENKPTYFHIIDKNKNSIRTVVIDKGFYIFHYANCIETDENIEIYACLYDNLSFSSLNIHGKYRKIIINKHTDHVEIETREWFEGLNLDFPVKFEDKIIMRSIINGAIDGLVIVRDMDIVKHLSFLDKFVCGEHSVLYIEGTPYLIVFLIHKVNPNLGFCGLVNLNTYENIEIPLPLSLTVGFHSIFIDKIESEKYQF